MAGPPLTPFIPMMVQVVVTFDALKLADGPISTNLSEKTLTVPQGLTMIVMRLTTINNPPDKLAVFQTSPIQWFEKDDFKTPVEVPGMFVVQRLGDWNVTLLDFNSTPESLTHVFNIVVAYDGKTYGSDPKIINEPPSG